MKTLLLALALLSVLCTSALAQQDPGPSGKNKGTAFLKGAGIGFGFGHRYAKGHWSWASTGWLGADLFVVSIGVVPFLVMDPVKFSTSNLALPSLFGWVILAVTERFLQGASAASALEGSGSQQTFISHPPPPSGPGTLIQVQLAKIPINF